ncbi:hypothetical protein YYC_03604 [Plasmodium yoelii 17X]|uniref:Drosophila melanogaster CG15040 gene product n=3 Tax=Plasmodium yoelii TaxID=5861 RepID=A0AAE9WKJ6_PLAYO|nr:uncharacterized protein PY17X_0520000 [Plasmodium yoelii]ETB58829.1 hypothetical protein YYC_03604 [Plasmodium yoelii 17X]WBY55728.1 hypothetical protein Py17XNL_000504554 [Plasmodium yoelii yoelii]CDU16789.1 conserved Plasmodium membrane protein, unknown function [Plasmodium yoelii]VTZ74404.1 conserved Plasmodium membrane protein, unknown function [Plasmodium yoelii]|eukprot:XP_728270.2 uncharacterized protein PY17X_0520000 [Plasmodium yoelii]
MKKIISINFYVALITVYAFYNNALCQVEANEKKTSLRNGNALSWSSLDHINFSDSEHKENKSQETKQSNADEKKSNGITTPIDLSTVVENGKENGDSNGQTGGAQLTDNKKEDIVPTASKNINGDTVTHIQENNTNPSSIVESEKALTKLEEVQPEKKNIEKNKELDENRSKVAVNTGNLSNINNSVNTEQVNGKNVSGGNISVSHEELPNAGVDSKINKNGDSSLNLKIEGNPINVDKKTQDKATDEKKNIPNNGNNNGEKLVPSEQLEGINVPDSAKNKESEKEKNDTDNKNPNEKNNLGLEHDIAKTIYEFIMVELPKDNVFTKNIEDTVKSINNDKNLVKNTEKNGENEKNKIIQEQPIKNQGELNNKNEPKTEGKETTTSNNVNANNTFSKIVENINAIQNEGTFLNNIINLFGNPGFISKDVTSLVKDAVSLISTF